MARDRKARMTTGSKYVAIGALTELLDPVVPVDGPPTPAETLASWIVDKAWDVEHFPVAGKVQITLDVSSLDRADENDQQND
jgi:hypothetical protein